MSDFGSPLTLEEGTLWTDQHEKVYQRMEKFYPPFMLGIYKQAATAADGKIKLTAKLTEQLSCGKNKTLTDVYCFGTFLLYILVGGYNWGSSIELQSLFSSRM